MEIEGELFAPLSSRSQRATLRIVDHWVGERLVSVRVDTKDVLTHVKVESIQEGKLFTLEGNQTFIADKAVHSDFLNQLQFKSHSFVRGLEQFTWKKAFIFSLFLIVFIAIVRLTLPTLTTAVATAIPATWERQLGESFYETLKINDFEESEIPMERQHSIIKQATKIAIANDIASVPQIYFHQSSGFGANALAFPGGPIVITDDLVKLLESDEEILAVIGHELAHVTQRHSLKQIAEILGLFTMAYFLLGNDDTLLEEAVFTALQLWSFSNSRDYEREADLIGIQYIEKAGLNKQHFIAAIKKLINSASPSDTDTEESDFHPEETEKSEIKDSVSDWFSTHPSGAERLRYLNEN